MMCLAIPGRLVEIFEESGLRMGRVDFAGTRQIACLEYLPEARTGHYVLVHAGFAISVVDEEEARKSLDIWRELVQAAAEEGTDVFGMPLDETPPATSGDAETE
jgi:hydrogenase expression/formation protein HypC